MKDSTLITLKKLDIVVHIPYENYTSSKLVAIEFYEDGEILYHMTNNNNELFHMKKE